MNSLDKTEHFFFLSVPASYKEKKKNIFSFFLSIRPYLKVFDQMARMASQWPDIYLFSSSLHQEELQLEANLLKS